jgi:hypothetical protein
LRGKSNLGRMRRTGWRARKHPSARVDVISSGRRSSTSHLVGEPSVPEPSVRVDAAEQHTLPGPRHSGLHPSGGSRAAKPSSRGPWDELERPPAREGEAQCGHKLEPLPQLRTG